MVEDCVPYDFGNRSAVAVDEHRDAEAPLGHKRHHRAPADPAAGMADDPLAAIVMGREAKPVMALADFGELRLSGVNARLVERLQSRGYAPACANEWVKGVCGKPQVKCGE